MMVPILEDIPVEEEGVEGEIVGPGDTLSEGTSLPLSLSTAAVVEADILSEGTIGEFGSESTDLVLFDDDDLKPSE